MAWAVRSAKNSGTGSVTVDLTAVDPPVAENDQVIVITVTGTAEFATTEETETYDPIVDEFSDDSSNCHLVIFRKTQTATPDTSVTINKAGGVNPTVALALVISGADPSGVLDVATTTATATNSGTPDNPANTPATANALVIAAAGSSEADAVTNPPTNHTLIDSLQAAVANVMASYRIIATPAEEDPASWADVVGTTADAWCAATIILRPAAEEPEPEPEEEAAPVLTYGAGRLSRERVEAKYREIEEIDRRIAAKEEAERERVRKVEEAKRQLADLAEKKRQTKTIAERRRKLEARIKADEAEILALRNAIAALVEQIELTQTIADRRRRMVLLLAAAA